MAADGQGITAIVLAAGRGVRMGPRGRLMPKGMLRLGARPLIAECVDRLRAWGAARILLVTGHLAEQYEALFAGTEVETVYNPLYAETGSLRSLGIGLAAATGPVVVVESDLTFETAALSPIRADLCRATLSSPTGSGDEQYVWAAPMAAGGMRFQEISKNPRARPEPYFGEHVGITGLTAPAARRLAEIADRMLTQDPAAHYEPALTTLGAETPIDCVRIEDLAWAEIDDETMFARVRDRVYPKVRARDAAGG